MAAQDTLTVLVRVRFTYPLLNFAIFKEREDIYMFTLTDGKNYVMENPMKVGNYISTTNPLQAKEFTYKQARSLLQNTRKSLSWIKSYHMINQETGEVETGIPKFCNEGIFCGDKEFVLKDEILDVIQSEINSIIGLTAWSIEELIAYNSQLNQGLQFYESAISDVKHARMDKRPPANIMTKVDKLLNELEEKRRDIK